MKAKEALKLSEEYPNALNTILKQIETVAKLGSKFTLVDLKNFHFSLLEENALYELGYKIDKNAIKGYAKINWN